jgi:hypothetical protein
MDLQKKEEEDGYYNMKLEETREKLGNGNQHKQNWKYNSNKKARRNVFQHINVLFPYERRNLENRYWIRKSVVDF